MTLPDIKILRFTTLEIDFRDRALIPVWEKVLNGESLNFTDGLTLFQSHDLIALGKMARAVKYEKSGDGVYFACNQKIEPTNICRLHCTVCAFSVREGDRRAYELSVEDVLGKIPPHVREVHITGALHPRLPWSYWVELIAAIRRAYPAVGIKAYTAVEIDYFHKRFRLPVKEILLQLKEAGLDSLPGGGAEVFSERVRRLLFPRKIGHKRWLEIHKLAHQLGIISNATMLYGHIETYAERVQHLLLLREAQAKTGGFVSFIPLPFQPGNRGIRSGNTSVIDDLKTIAASRLLLDNFPCIKAYWVMLTPEAAALSLHFGADDLDGTVGGEKIAHAAGAAAPQELPADRLITMIGDEGLIAVERDVFYNPLRIFGKRVVGKIPYLNSAPFYRHFPRRPYRLLPITPRHMGILSRRGEIEAGPFSLMDYLVQRDVLEPMDYCIAAPKEVGSVLLFSRRPWPELAGGKIGITDDTATSVRLLEVLLRKRFHIEAQLVRMQAKGGTYTGFDALLLIGDEALQRNKTGIPGFAYVYDLAGEWYEWQKLPFVFAVWAHRKDLPSEDSLMLRDRMEESLKEGEKDLRTISAISGRRLGLSTDEAERYLAAFQYRLGPKEKEAIALFERLLHD